MDELIYRYALLEQIEKDSEGTLGSYGDNWQFINTIRKMPTIERRPRGHWIDIDMQAYTWKVRCSNCGNERSMMSTQGVYPNFCEHCGADMKGE